MNKVLVFIPIYNEIENIEKLINNILKLNIKLDIFVIDDNSPDQSKLILKKICLKNKNVKFKNRKSKLGLDTAHREAFLYSIKMNYKYLITMDGDLSHDPIDIANFLKEIENNDFVIGSRYMIGGKNKMKGFRFLLSYFGNFLIKFLLKIKTLDEFTTSYRCIRVKKLKQININEIKAKGYSFFMNCIYIFHKNNFKISQIPIVFSDRLKGKSKIPKTEILRTLYNLILIKFKI